MMVKPPAHSLVFSAGLCMLLAACGSAPQRADGDAAAGSRQASAGDAPLRAFEAQWRERAAAAQRQSRLADAALAWEVLALLRPGVYDGELAAVRERIAGAFADRMRRGEQEFKRGNLEKAEQLYLAALALQPHQEDAANALRALDRAHNKRDFLGQASRLTVGKAVASGQFDASLEREQVAALVSQGELDEAIALLESRLAAAPGDTLARARLADVYVKKAQQALPQNVANAKAWLTKALRWAPEHAGASGLMKSLHQEQ